MTPEAFRDARVALDLSQSRLARIAGVETRTLRRYEQAVTDAGYSAPPAAIVLLLRLLEMADAGEDVGQLLRDMMDDEL